MSGYNTYTSTSTYTVVDIRKTFEGFCADVRMIALRTDKWTTEYTEKIIHDVLKLAEAKYINYVDITLLDSSDSPIRASRYVVTENGTALSSERPGGNNWPNSLNTRLAVIISHSSSWNNLTDERKMKFRVDNSFKLPWVNSSIDNSYNHLSSQSGQLYGSKGYELQKQNFS